MVSITNPGPENWSALRAPNYCNFLRVAIYKVFIGEKLIPSKEDSGDEIISVEDGFNDLQLLFGHHFQAHLIDLKVLKKNISRFTESMIIWGKKSAPKRNEYCSIFSPSNWNDLSGKSKTEHTVFCSECPKLNGHGMFPSSSIDSRKTGKQTLHMG